MVAAIAIVPGQIVMVDQGALATTSYLRLFRTAPATVAEIANYAGNDRQRILEDGAKLWSRLIHLASESRATGGYFPDALRISI